MKRHSGLQDQETIMEKVNALKLEKDVVSQSNRLLKPLAGAKDRLFQRGPAQHFNRK
jgi:hypothetical protein